MCGIAGFSLAPGVQVDASALVRLLIAGLAERGEDACGFAWRVPGQPVEVVKSAMPPLRFLAEVPIVVPPQAREVIIHVRDHTKGRPTHDANNHPVRHGRITGVHNGIIQNDDALFAAAGRERAVPGMSVDSEAIFMLLDLHDAGDEAWPRLVGSYSTAFLDDTDHDGLHLVRGRGRPLVLAAAPGIAAFASTRHALEFAASRLELELELHGVRPAQRMRLAAGLVCDTREIEVADFDERATVDYAHDDPAATRARELALGQLDAPAPPAAGDGEQRTA